MPFSLAIVGRPNVGKSTLFNRLVGRKLALVDDQPGVTRDLREGEARLGHLRFTVIDTAGLEEVTDQSLQGRMRALTEKAVAMADASLFLIDARVGVTPSDLVFADILRRGGKPVLLAANKAEGRAGEAGALEGFALGLGEVISISAEHGEGMDELRYALLPFVEAHEDEEAPAGDEAGRPIQIAIVGRPNAGKSTLVNAILGQERMLTGPEAGITRDAIASDVDWAGTPMRIFDTAGLRKKARIDEKLEKLSVSDALRAVRFAEVVVVLLDVNSPFDQQDLRIADLAEREGRAVVLAVNKWDLEADKSQRAVALREEFERLLPQLRGAPLVTLSALTGRGVDKLREAILKVHGIWNTRITTAQLNRWLNAMLESHPPPAPSGRRIKLRYMTQVKARPPSFVAFCSLAEELPESYRRFLVNGLRKAFALDGTPIRLDFRKTENPFAGKKERRRDGSIKRG